MPHALLAAHNGTASPLPQQNHLLPAATNPCAHTLPLQVAARPENAGKLIVTVLPSYGERYQSTDLLKEEREAALSATIY